MVNSTAIASGYAGRDPQGGTSDGTFSSKFSFMLQRMVKILLLVFKKKREKELSQVRKVEKTELDMYKEMEKE